MTAMRLHPLSHDEQVSYIALFSRRGHLLVPAEGRTGYRFVCDDPDAAQPGPCKHRRLSPAAIDEAARRGLVESCTAVIGEDLLGPQPVPAWRARGRI
ncbi:hypothetical protein [Methylobacterium sp. JK268]